MATAAALPWYVLVLPTAVVWTTWAENSISPLAALRALAVANGAAAVALLVAWVALRDGRRAGIAVVGLEVLLLSKMLSGLLATIFVRSGLAASIVLGTLLVVTLALAARIAWRARARVSAASAHRMLGVMAACLIVVLAGSLAISPRLGWALEDIRAQGASFSASTGGRSTVGDSRPDIYVLMMDGYPRADVLASRLAFDNAPFLDALAAREFEVAEESHSGYMWTGLSLTALLNMAYVEQVPDFARIIEGEVPTHQGVRTAINNGQVFEDMRAAGYQVVATASGYEQMAARTADAWLSTDDVTEFEVMLLESTFVGDFVNLIDPDFASRGQHERVEDTFEALADIASARGDRPRFVFAHLPVPHQPTVFGPDGEPIAVPITADFYGDSAIEREVPIERFVADYTGQVKHVNRLLLGVVDAILERSSISPVIIVLSDHGSASTHDWRASSWRTADPAAVLERTGTLFAARTPGRQDVFPADVEIVHVLALLERAYLDIDRPLASPPSDGIQIPKVEAHALGSAER